MLTLSLKMPLGEALAVSVIGLVTVISILAIIACLIVLVSKVIRTIEAAFQKKSAPAGTQVKTAAPTAPAAAADNSVELIDTDEKTAAVVMAIVAKESGIPLNRLKFESIRLMEDEKKGEK